MKNLFFFLLTTCSIAAMGQPSDTLFMSKLIDMQWTKNYSNSSQFRFVMFEDGSVLSVGDKMRFGIPSGTNQSSSVQPGLFNSNVTRTNNYTYIMLGRMGIAIVGGVTYLPENFKGKDAQIEKLLEILQTKGNK
jgi:hypothetical protein